MVRAFSLKEARKRGAEIRYISIRNISRWARISPPCKCLPGWYELQTL